MRKPTIHVLVSGVATAILIYFVFSEITVSEFLTILERVDRTYLYLYIGLSISALLVRVVRYRWLLLDMVGLEVTPSYPKLLIVTAVRNALVDFLPARLGEASYLYMLHRFGVSLTLGVASFGFAIVLDVLVLLVLTMLLFAGVQLFGGGSSLITTLMPDANSQTHVLIICGVAVLSALLVVLTLYLDKLIGLGNAIVMKCVALLPEEGRVRAWLTNLVSFAEGVGEGFSAVRTNRTLGWHLAVTAVLRMAKYGSLYVLLLAVVAQWNIGLEHVDPFSSTVAFIAAEAGASLPISGIMSFGAYEGVWAVVFSASCPEVCAQIPSTAVALAIHLITQIVGYSLGLLGLGAFFFIEVKAGKNFVPKAR